MFAAAQPVPLGSSDSSPTILETAQPSLALGQTQNMKISIPTAIRPFRLITADIRSLRLRYASDWTTFNQLIFASAVYVFFTNLLPGITFASDLYVLTGKSWGTIEVVLSTGLCGIVFAMCVRNIAADIYTY